MKKVFHVCSIVNDLAQYREQRRTFQNAGFTDENCRFTLYDNSGSNTHEPFSTINRACKATPEDFLIFCHQDIRLPVAASFDRLTGVLADLEARDETWAVCGNAGGLRSQGTVRHLTDPSGVFEEPDLPQPVQSLDENFLVLKTASGVRCSAQLQGFHLYATDLCLHAEKLGRSTYVIPFHLTHLSGGKLDAGFKKAEQAFRRVWNESFRFRYVRNTCTLMFLSRWRILRVCFGWRRVVKWLNDHPSVLRAIATVPPPARRSKQ